MIYRVGACVCGGVLVWVGGRAQMIIHRACPPRCTQQTDRQMERRPSKRRTGLCVSPTDLVQEAGGDHGQVDDACHHTLLLGGPRLLAQGRDGVRGRAAGVLGESGCCGVVWGVCVP